MRTQRSHKPTDWYNKFRKSEPSSLLERYQKESDRYWQMAGRNFALRLFHEMAVRVPAYKDFLKSHSIDPTKIKSYTDLKNVSPIDKPNYIDKYDLNLLCWDGTVDAAYMLSASSGSTGQPYFWPRSDEQTMQGAILCELVYREFFEMDRLSTLYIIAFGMGTWIAGTYMMMATQWVAQKGFPITVTTPGINITEILRLVRIGEKYYDQIVLIGLPPFIRDVVDAGIDKGLCWKDLKIRFVFTGEAFTERWRDHLARKVGFDQQTDAINLYGSADVGLIAHETPTTIFIRRLAANNKEILKNVFRSERVPSVNQFNPKMRHFECLNGDLLITARSMIPLLRYNTKDIGDVIFFSDAAGRLRDIGIDITNEFTPKGRHDLLWKLPIVYLFGRGNFSASIYGITLFPEFIKFVLDNSVLEHDLTGKFLVETEEKKDLSQQLHLRVELKSEARISMELNEKVKQTFIQELPKISSEYSHLLESINQRAHPKITLHNHEDSSYFPPRVVNKTT